MCRRLVLILETIQGPADSSTTKKRKNATGKRSQKSPDKTTAKRLFMDNNDGSTIDQGCADAAAKPAASNDA